jgi:hypothetical protein
MSRNIIFVLMYHRHRLLEIMHRIRQWNQCNVSSYRGKLQGVKFIVKAVCTSCIYCRVFARQRDKKLCGFRVWRRRLLDFRILHSQIQLFSTCSVVRRFLFTITITCTAELGEMSSALLGAQLPLVSCRIRTHSC